MFKTNLTSDTKQSAQASCDNHKAPKESTINDATRLRTGLKLFTTKAFEIQSGFIIARTVMFTYIVLKKAACL